MGMANRYGGSSRAQRSFAALMAGGVVLLMLLALIQAMRGAMPRMTVPVDRLIAFTVAPPPPPPPPPPLVLDRSTVPARLAAASAPRIAHPAIPAGPTRSHDLTPPAALAPITASPASNVALSLGSDSDRLDLGGGGDGTSGGGGGGTGSGAGDGGGSTRPVRLARAEWIVPPSQLDFARAWPRFGLNVTASVEVILLCRVRHNGHPFDCTVARESMPGKGFGAAAISVIRNSLIRPLMIDDRRVDIRVIVPVIFVYQKRPDQPSHPRPAG